MSTASSKQPKKSADKMDTTTDAAEDDDDAILEPQAQAQPKRPEKPEDKRLTNVDIVFIETTGNKLAKSMQCYICYHALSKMIPDYEKIIKRQAEQKIADPNASDLQVQQRVAKFLLDANTFITADVTMLKEQALARPHKKQEATRRKILTELTSCLALQQRKLDKPPEQIVCAWTAESIPYAQGMAIRIAQPGGKHADYYLKQSMYPALQAFVMISRLEHVVKRAIENSLKEESAAALFALPDLTNQARIDIWLALDIREKLLNQFLEARAAVIKHFVETE